MFQIRKRDDGISLETLGCSRVKNLSFRGQAAIDLTIEAGDWATALGCEEVCVWSAWDGYDYSLQVDYHALWQRVVDGFRAVCDAHPKLRVSLEFKPTDENTRFFAVPSPPTPFNPRPLSLKDTVESISEPTRRRRNRNAPFR